MTQTGPEPWQGYAKQLIGLVRTHMEEPAPPPDRSRRFERLVYGFAQPLWGMRTVWRDTNLLGLALAPVLLVAAVCAFVAYGQARDHEWWRFAATFFATFAALAPVPPVLFQRTYARISSRVRNEMGLGPREPYLRSFGEAFKESITLVIVIAVGVAPLSAVAGWMPLFGALWAALVHGVWSMHWIVVEAFDTARTLEPGQTVEQVERESAEREGVPWYARIYRREFPKGLGILVLPFKIFADIAAGMAARWRPEVDRVEQNPWLTVGFGLGTVLLLAIPGVNIFFRPAIVIGAAHLSGRLDMAEQDLEPRLGPTGTHPFPTVG
jgi:hypothetical protein